MKSLFAKTKESYDGTQLRSLFGYMEYGLLGDSVIAWIGPCSVSFDHMVDGEDLRAEAKIQGEQMVHFIIELFDRDLFAAVNVQRLLASIVMEHLRKLSKNEKLRREGDDIYLDDKKLASPLPPFHRFPRSFISPSTSSTTAHLCPHFVCKISKWNPTNLSKIF